MPKKIDGARRCADVLAALARCANVRLALQECGVSHYWAYGRKRADPDFAARWATAVRTGRRRLARAAARRAVEVGAANGGAAPAHGAGEVLVGSSGKGTIRLERAKPCSFTADKQARFLSVLRVTSNVTAAAKAAGVSRHGAHDRYRADAAFRAEWVAALAEGRDHLEMALQAAARAAAEGRTPAAGETAATPAIVGMDAHVALQLVRLGDRREARGRRPIKPADAEQVRATILAKTAAVRAARAREADGA